MKVYQLAVPRENEYTPEAAASIFSSLAHLRRPSLLKRWIHQEHGIRASLEVMVVGQKVHFFAAVSDELGDYFVSQVHAAYPLAIIAEQEDYLPEWEGLDLHVAQVVQASGPYYPVKTYKEFSDIDPMVLLLGVMSKAEPHEVMLFQMVLTGAGNSWRQQAYEKAQGKTHSDGTVVYPPNAELITAKSTENGFWTALRVASNHPHNLDEMGNAFGSLSRGDGNRLALVRPNILQKNSIVKGLFERSLAAAPSTQIFTVSELATIWHMPNQNIKVQNLTWAKNMETEAPDNLPIAQGMTEEEKKEVNFFARTNFKGEEMVFGIKREDRTRHMYVIGKSGVGKSTLLENMAINDMKKGEGLAFLDPHGGSVEVLLDYIPKHRINDVVYFDPSDTQYPIPMNILEVVDPGQREFVASGIVSIFAKLYAHSWGPRLEYILRNTLLTLTEYPGATIPNIIDILTNKNFRDKVLPHVTDEVMRKFWEKEFNRWEPRAQTEAVAPILNKVGQFVSSPLIRKIITPQHSSLDIPKIMDEGKILLANLSQGKMGEDNAALMGAMMVTKIQLSAMQRAKKEKSTYRDFWLYVDEFQNFATSSFIKILSEARKYRLGLIMANQYVEQIDDEIMAAVLGNAGTLVNFLVDVTGAKRLVGEYGGLFEENDLVTLGRGEVVVKLAIDGLTSRAFFAKTLMPAASSNQNKDKVIKVSRERWAKPVESSDSTSGAKGTKPESNQQKQNKPAPTSEVKDRKTSEVKGNPKDNQNQKPNQSSQNSNQNNKNQSKHKNDSNQQKSSEKSNQNSPKQNNKSNQSQQNIGGKGPNNSNNPSRNQSNQGGGQSQSGQNKSKQPSNNKSQHSPTSEVKGNPSKTSQDADPLEALAKKVEEAQKRVEGSA